MATTLQSQVIWMSNEGGFSDMKDKKETCHFCQESNVLECHHIIPKRLGGSNDSKNILVLCPTCHAKIEKIYDDSFFERICNLSQTSLQTRSMKIKEAYTQHSGNSWGRPQEYSKDQKRRLVKLKNQRYSYREIKEKVDFDISLGALSNILGAKSGS